MSNRERLEEAGILKQDADLTQEQSEAIESLTPEEVEMLISVNNKLSDAFTAEPDETMSREVHRLGG